MVAPARPGLMRGTHTALAVVCGALMGVHLSLGRGFIDSAAPTYDEPVHLASGYSYWKTETLRLNIKDHPPLAEMWAAMPLLPMRPHLFLQHPDWVQGRLYHYADFFLHRNRFQADEMLGRARRFCLATWTFLLFPAVLLWARRAAGSPGMLAAAAVYAFSPMLLSNMALVTTDGACAAWFFLSLWLLSAAPREADGRRALAVWAASGACAGLGLASKYNMIVLPLIAAACLLVERRLDPAPRPWPWKGAAAFAGAAALALAAAYRFTSLPLYWEGLSGTFGRLQEGRSSFFFGSHSTTGAWPYFPAALAVKTPLAAWFLAAAGLARLWRGKDPRERLWILLPPAVFLAAAMTSKVQIGVRHVLPVVPFLAVVAGCGGAWLWERRDGGVRWGRAATGVLGLWLAASVIRNHPDHLAYFNEAAGGPSNGWRLLTDSNLDWGQSLKGLAVELRRRGNPPVYLSYFGTGDPHAYGLRYVPVACVSNADRAGDPVDPAALGTALLAVSATNLQSTYYPDKAVFAWLKPRLPAAVIGHSMFLYDLTSDAEGRRELARVLKLLGRPAEARSLLVESRHDGA